MDNKEYRPILKIGVKNLNDRIYSEESCKTIEKQFLQKKESGIPMYGELGHPENFDISIHRFIGFTDDLKLQEDILYGRFIPIENESLGLKKDDIISLLDEGKLVLRPRSTGTINTDGTVNIEKIFAFDLIQSETDSFKGII